MNELKITVQVENMAAFIEAVQGLQSVLAGLTDFALSGEAAAKEAAVPVPVEEAPAPVEAVAAPVHSLDEIRALFMEKRSKDKSAGMTKGLQSLLRSVGASSVSEIKPEDYETVVQALELL